jgi:hypothetical protein
MAFDSRTNTGIRRTEKVADGGFLSSLQMPILTSAMEPGRRPGNFGLFGDQVCVHKQDHSVLCLSGLPTLDNWADVVARGTTLAVALPLQVLWE